MKEMRDKLLIEVEKDVLVFYNDLCDVLGSSLNLSSHKRRLVYKDKEISFRLIGKGNGLNYLYLLNCSNKGLERRNLKNDLLKCFIDLGYIVYDKSDNDKKFILEYCNRIYIVELRYERLINKENLR